MHGVRQRDSGSGEDGVYLQWGSAVIANNTISGTMGVGIFLYETRGSAVTNNTLSGNGMVGIYLSSSPAYLDGNRLTDCSIALWFDDFYNEARFIDGTNITSTNTINGLPVYFLENKNMDNATMGSGWGEVILLNVTYLKVSDLSFSYGGVIAAWSVNVTVEGNTFDNAADAVVRDDFIARIIAAVYSTVVSTADGVVDDRAITCLFEVYAIVVITADGVVRDDFIARIIAVYSTVFSTADGVVYDRAITCLFEVYASVVNTADGVVRDDFIAQIIVAVYSTVVSTADGVVDDRAITCLFEVYAIVVITADGVVRYRVAFPS